MLKDLLGALLCACGLHDYIACIWQGDHPWFCARCGRFLQSR